MGGLHNLKSDARVSFEEPGDKVKAPRGHLFSRLSIDLQGEARDLYRRSSKLLPWGDHVLLWAGASGFCLVGVMSVLSLTGVVWIRLFSSRPGPLTVTVDCSGHDGDLRETGYILKGARWAPFLQVEGAWKEFPDISAAYDGYGVERIHGTRRGKSENLTRVLRVGDFLGLTAVIFQLPAVRSVVTILPHKIEVVKGFDLPLATQTGDDPMAGGAADGDRVDIRQYQLGDSARHILWTLVARTGGEKLYVRIPEPVAQSVTALFLVAGEGDDGSAEFARFLVDDKLPTGSWILGTSRSDTPTQDRFEALRLIAESGNVGTPSTPIVEPHVAFSRFEQFCVRRQCRNVILLVPHDEDAIKEVGRTTLVSQRVFCFGSRGEAPPDWSGSGNSTLSGIEFVRLRHV